jgi:hypothetical protein
MNILDWGDVGYGKMIVFFILCVIFYFTIFEFFNGNDRETQRELDKIQYNCIPCKTDLCKKVVGTLRGKNYFMPSDSEENTDEDRKFNEEVRECAFTLWEGSHVLTHIFLGYFYNIYVSQSTSILFELWEWKYHDCGSILDLGWNFFGFLMGHTLKNMTKGA